MKKPLQSALLLLAPCGALMGLAFYLTRRAPVAPPSVRTTGRLQITVAGVEARKLKPVNVFEGYDRHFDLVFGAEGARPAGWGSAPTERNGTEMKGFKFWLERGGKRQPFAPSKTQIWTSRWDENKRRYSNEILLHSGAIPDDMALKMRGSSQIFLSASAPSTFGPPIPFEVTLKKAGQKWVAPQVSTAPGLVVQKIEIQKPKGGQTLAKISLLLTSNARFNNTSLRQVRFLKSDWSQRWGILSNSVGGGSGPGEEGSRRFVLEMQWNAPEIKKAPERDLIASTFYGVTDSWPLEIAFYIKRNGQLVYGIVPALSRPRSK